MKRFILITAAVLMQLQCLAWYPMVKNFSKEIYKGGAQNWSITQGEGGNMWFANSGLTEFDGREWSLHHASNMSSIRSVMYDAQTGRLYFGATDEVGYLYINSDNKVQYVSLKERIGFPLGEIWGIHKDAGCLWLRENNNMFRFDFKEAKRFYFTDKVAVSAMIGGRITIFVNNLGMMQMADDGQFRQIPGTGWLKDKRVCAILPHKDHMLIATANSGVYTFANGQLKEYETEFSRNLKENTIYCAESNGRHIAFGTVRDGVYIEDLSDGSSIHLNTQSGLLNNTVLSLYYSPDGNLWLGLDKGISLVELSGAEYRLFGNGNDFGAGYASEIFDSKLWLGTNQGLYVTEYIKGGRHQTDSDIRMIPSVKSQVWNLMKHDGRLFCCNDKGIDIIRNGITTHIAMNGAWKLEPLRNHPELLLGSSYDRLFLLSKNGGSWRFDKWITGFDDASKVFEEDADGYIWFSHWIKGLFRLKIDYDSGAVTENTYMSKGNGFPEDWGNTPMDINGRIIFHTADGFHCFDGYNGKAYPHEQMNSLFESAPAGTSIYVTDKKDFYFSSWTTQILSYSKDGHFVTDSLSLKHLASKRIPGFEDIRDIGDDMLLINTEDGFSLIRTEIVKNKAAGTDKSLYIKEISITQTEGDSVIFSSRSNSTCRKADIRLAHRHNSIKIKAKLPVYTTGSETQYSFYLEKYDKGWSKYSGTDTKEYTGLPAGKYVYRVKAKTSDCDTVYETSIAISIDTPWFLTWWALMLYALFLAGIVFLCRAAIKAYMNRKVRIMQMQLDFEHKALDLAASTMNVIRKNEILLEIDKSLSKVAEYMAEDRNKSLKILGRIRAEIKDNIQHDDIWQDFEGNFDIVYNDFLKRLGEKYPALTVTDKKMCTYLKMNLSSKEIAPLLNMTLRSIEMTRYRIRKKLGLSREDNLTEFLQKF